MKCFLYFFIVLLSAILVAYMTLLVFASDFDKFAKAAIKGFGHKSDPQLVTYAVLQYLKENQIDDLIAFFE